MVRSVHLARLHPCDKERLRRILTRRFWLSFWAVVIYMMGLLRWLSGKESTCQLQETWVRSPVPEDPLEKEMVTHSNILA